MSQNIRVRFAPSPTGALHIGGVRTALYNYLFARQHQGTFILRIEDTDQNRMVSGAEKYIMDTLDWLGLETDESPRQEGPHQPYRQSERKDLYRKYADQLIQSDKAYYAFDSKEDLEKMRLELEAAKAKNVSYNAITRLRMKNSLTMSAEEVQQHLDQGSPYVIRIKMPPKEEIRFEDLIQGWAKAHSSTLDDKVLIKEDGLPTYHLANVVDDYLMKITHVIRGKEWLPSAYLHVLLYEFLGWKKEMPRFAHLPLLLKPSGKGKLSKRDGLKLGIPVFPLAWKDEETQLKGFREDGFRPEALLNFLAFLGWNPGTEQEIFSMEELIQSFDLERVVKSDAVFNFEKAIWFNQQYLKELSDEELGTLLQAEIQAQGLSQDLEDSKANRIAGLMKERINFPGDILKEATYFFQSPTEFDPKTLKKRWKEEGIDFVKEVQSLLTDFSGNWEAEALRPLIHAYIEQKELPMGKTLPALRLALTGQGGGPDIMGIMEVIGKENCQNRLQYALENLGKS